MYDFCWSYPYAALIAGCGITAFVYHNSAAALVNGLFCAALIFGAAYTSHYHYRKGVVFWPTIVFSLMISGGVAITTYHQWQKTGEFFPQGLVCSISVAGMFFYIYNLSYIPTPKRKL